MAPQHNRPRRRQPTVFACYGYTDSPQPSLVMLYRDQGASQQIGEIATSDPTAPKRTDTTVTIKGVTYCLIWID